ncbi:MAG: ribonuclease Y, partial [Gemmatimonadales bacterium]
ASARADSEALLVAARREAENVKTSAVVEGKMAALKVREEIEEQLKQRRDEIDRTARRTEEAERNAQRRGDQLDHRERDMTAREQRSAGAEAQLKEKEGEVEQIVQGARDKLEEIAGLSRDDARREVLGRAEDEAKAEAAALAREIKEQARRTADKEARRIIAIATQRLAAETTSESTVASVALPNDEMKGRIIGREGRNIRAFETATGVDVIIDDTPDTVVISCFNPIRREVAKRALEALITDGRIQPGRIEEIVVKVEKQLDEELVELGEEAAYETGIHGLHAELIKLVGRMRYRTSYGQNIYDHSKEVAWLAGMMAAELHLDVALAKRGALLHDLGKALTHDHEGTHVELGVEMARKYGESDAVINCIQAHHNDVPHESAESVLVQAADAISGARPGARREAFESYVKRLTNLEEIANGFPGVEKTNVIQAGREVRVIVTPEKVGDDAAATLAEDIAKRIEQELQYPGQIRVVVIRETRSVGVAK